MKQSTPPAILRQRIAALVTEQAPTQRGDTVIVAVSGGPDSVALLHILCSTLPLVRFIAVYVDHGLRPNETGAEIELVQALAHQLQAGFERVSVDVRTAVQQEKTSIEETARTLRYQALEAMRHQYQGTAIAVAHTADDQAEEILIRLIRGSGRKGLSGMQFKNSWVIRPLLHESKETLLYYLQVEQIPFSVDSSNLERTYLRNRVRLDLLPYLQDHFNKSIRQTLLQTTQILEDEEALLEEMAGKAWQEAVSVITIEPVPLEAPSHIIQIDTKEFCKCHPALQRRILEKCCWQMEERPQFRQIELLLDLVHRRQGGAQIHLSKGLRVHKRGRELIFSYPAGKCNYRGGMTGGSNDDERSS
ncbi:MAG: tRNA lysidine(34) synthetase TilS [Proteobacteria bacterium]|nr:tRNA lysidine(34) synthetase TilS [Pseudomonadota bacterium]MCG2743959.1 tRNA lysidine(34) synthetase TilS [Desulfobacteraceae bacterium]MBU3982662.1 tRNA lysidine(34) synthetase TilS [Pseudomonadota bacterium]MBU4029747.1 tRNA lysidine(34) synthetase TilS [Pseudomonadota bacterium]MBU4043397.1 tRNA lysidine(34) synthetase TilS [Pseudomonadota bacterium]